MFFRLKSEALDQIVESKWTCHYEPVDDGLRTYYLKSGSDYYSVEEDEWLTQSEYNDILSDGDGDPLLEVTAEALDWEVAWGLMPANYIGNITGDWSSWNDYVGSEVESGSDKNLLMRGICTATKTSGVVVYSIGFSVPENGTAETELRNCASDPLLYYRASTTTISDAFGSIASNVQNLRLTQ